MTATEKLAAVEREIKYRRRVYPRLIASGDMTDAFAAHQIEIFDEIAEDYRALTQKEKLL